MARMKKIFVIGIVLGMLALVGTAVGQKDKDEPTCFVYFTVIKDDNGKPVRNAAVIMHPVNPKGKQERGGMELKTDPEGKTNFDGIPYGRCAYRCWHTDFRRLGKTTTSKKRRWRLLSS